MALQSGQLTARLAVSSLTLVDLPNGGQEEQLVPVLVDTPSTPAMPLSADEGVRQGAQFATATHRVQLRMPRAASGAVIVVTPAMQAQVRNAYTGLLQDFAIVAVNNVNGRGRELELVLEERVT